MTTDYRLERVLDAIHQPGPTPDLLDEPDGWPGQAEADRRADEAADRYEKEMGI